MTSPKIPGKTPKFTVPSQVNVTGYLNVPAALAVIVPVTAVCLTFVAFVYSPNAAALTDSVTGRRPDGGQPPVALPTG